MHPGPSGDQHGTVWGDLCVTVTALACVALVVGLVVGWKWSRLGRGELSGTTETLAAKVEGHRRPPPGTGLRFVCPRCRSLFELPGQVRNPPCSFCNGELVPERPLLTTVAATATAGPAAPEPSHSLPTTRIWIPHRDRGPCASCHVIL